MAVGIEDILLARSMADQERRIDPGEGAILGAGIAGTAGIAIGDLAQRINPSKNPLKPGMRMAGGLVGAILGGALGVGTAAMMKQNSPAANILAKLQTEGDLTPADQQALQSILADTYSNTLSM